MRRRLLKTARVLPNLLIRETIYMTNDEFDEIENPEICPECETQTIVRSNDGSYEYCTLCGLVTRASQEYCAGIKFRLPYGLLII